MMFNVFAKSSGFEFLGTYETAKGRTKTETDDRKATQLAVEGVYRMGKAENVFVGVRYNTVKARLAGYTNDVSVNRTAFAAGWFITKNVLMKAEIVDQRYIDFVSTDFRAGGKFNGFVLEAIVGF